MGIRTCSEVSNILSPLKSSTPKLKRLKPNTDVVDSSKNKSLNENSDSDFKETNITDNETDSDERITTKRKSKLSLSRRYGAGSTKKTPCPVCQELIRESIINFHLDHCLGQQSDNARNSKVATRARIASKEEKHLSSKKELEVQKESNPTKHFKSGPKQDIKGNTSIELFNDDSDDELNFPLSQIHNKDQAKTTKVNETSLTLQESQLSRFSSTDTYALLNVTPDIIEESHENDNIDFSELIESNLEKAGTNTCSQSTN